MLPDFPAIKARRQRRLMRIAESQADARHAVLSKLAVRVQHEGKGWSSGTVQGDRRDVLGNNLSGNMAFHNDDWPTMTDEKMVERLRTALDTVSDQKMDLLLGELDRVTKATGNVIEGKKGKVTLDQLLEMMDKTEIPFENGKPQGSFLMAPEEIEHVKTLEWTDELNRRYSQILERQFADWRLRQVDRKLVD